MPKLKLSSLNLDTLQSVVDIQEHPIDDYPWLVTDHVTLSSDDEQQLQAIVRRLRRSSTNLLNEATVWGKAIFPLLLLAEHNSIEAWAEVPLSAQYPQFELDGVADGVLGRGLAGRLTTPYLVMIEAKRGIDGENPIFQLYGQLLCGAWKNWKQNQQDPQEIFGCYTIGQTWQFVRAEICGVGEDADEGMQNSRPRLTVEYSQEYPEKTEAEAIAKILKSIVQRYE